MDIFLNSAIGGSTPFSLEGDDPLGEAVPFARPMFIRDRLRSQCIMEHAGTLMNSLMP